MSGESQPPETTAPEVAVTDGELPGATRDASDEAGLAAALRRFDDVVVEVDELLPDATLPDGSGMDFEDEEQGPGRLSVLVPKTAADDVCAVLVVELSDWSVSAPLTCGQLHRLVNGLAGRGRRNTVRPLAADERHVHLTGTPERLRVDYGDQTVEIPAGPKRGLSRVLRALETRTRD